MSSNNKKYKVLFADLDDTLIKTVTREDFPKGIWDMVFNFPVWNRIKELQPRYIFIVTNQAGIEQGYVNEQDFIAKADYICKALKAYVSNPEYKPEACALMHCSKSDPENPNRKPNIGMLQKMLDKCLTDDNIQKKDCLMIGDASGKEGNFSDSDLKTAENFGIDYMDVEEFASRNDIGYKHLLSQLISANAGEEWEEVHRITQQIKATGDEELIRKAERINSIS